MTPRKAMQPSSLLQRPPMTPVAGAGVRRAFTLIEVLVAISIMAILAGLVAAAVFQAENAAKYRKTEALIMKLHNDIMLRMEEMRERRLPYEADQAITNYLAVQGVQPHQPGYLLEKARYQLAARRELQRLELPDRFSDLEVSYQIAGATSYFPYGTPVSQAYAQALPLGASLSHESAECLYLIVTTTAPGDNAERLSFKADEVGDVDGDGLKEFLDAWGRPIQFIRWPAGMVSDLQPLYPIDPTDQADPDYKEYQKPGVDWSNYPTQQKRNKTFYLSRKSERNHDPFDVRLVDRYSVTAGGQDVPVYYKHPEIGYRLVPLIVSAGRDGVWDLEFGRDVNPANDLTHRGPFYNPYVVFNGRQLGASADIATRETPADGADNSGDNIHNHYLAQSEK